MENIDKLRKQTDGIILYVLTKGLRHIDELKQIIDEKFSPIKTGTLYSIISRLKTQKYLTETRASSLDGSRRKYFSLTKQGETLFNEKYLNVFNDIEIPNSTFVPQNLWQMKEKSVEITKTENVAIEIENKQDFNTNTEILNEFNVSGNNNQQDNQSYLDLIKSADFSFDEIDFSKIENDKNTEIVEKNKDNSKIEYNSQLSNEIKAETVQTSIFNNEEIENLDTDSKNTQIKDFDSVISSEFDYSNILNRLFPKTSDNVSETINENEEIVKEEQINISTVKNTWNDAYELAEKDGIKIRTSSDTNRYQGNKILINKLLLFTSIITFFLASFEYLLFNLIFSVPLSLNTYSKIAIIFGIIILITLTIYLLYPKYGVKDLPRFSNCLEIALIITIATLVICFAISAIIEIDFSNILDVYNTILLPTIISLNIPLFFIIEYSISKLDIFQTI